MDKIEHLPLHRTRETLLENKNNLRPIHNHEYQNTTSKKSERPVPLPWTQSLSKPPPPPVRRPPLVSTISDDHLGYDWIAAMLDNQKCSPHAGAGNQPSNTHWLKQSELFETIAKFRQTNYDVCCSRDSLSPASGQTNDPYNQTGVSSTGSRIRAHMDQLRPIRGLPTSTNAPSSESPLIYSYTLNTRLFPIPSDSATFARAPPQPGQNHILRVTVPLHYFHRPPELLRKVIAARGSSLGTAEPLFNKNSFSGTDSPSPFIQSDCNLVGTMSLSGHCHSNVNKHDRREMTTFSSRLRRLACARVLSLDGQSNSAADPEHNAPLPRWLRYQPETEREAVASVMKTQTYIT